MWKVVGNVMQRLVTTLLTPSVLAIVVLAQAPQKQTFTGVITDDMCAKEGHARMRMGPTDAECTVACVASHDAKYVLNDGKDIYVLSDQKVPQEFAGQKVSVVGTLDVKTRTIQVESISAAK
jgi:uncharacterized protein DUF5818